MSVRQITPVQRDTEQIQCECETDYTCAKGHGSCQSIHPKGKERTAPPHGQRYEFEFEFESAVGVQEPKQKVIC